MGFINPVSHPQVGVENRAGPGKGKDHLIVFSQRAGKKGSTESLPTPSTLPEFHIFPHVAVFNLTGTEVLIPSALGKALHVLNNIPIELDPADIAHMKQFENLEELLIHETTVQVKNDRDLFTVSLADRTFFPEISL